MKYSRNCPNPDGNSKCKGLLFYSSLAGMQGAELRKSLCLSCSQCGSKNHRFGKQGAMRGKTLYDIWFEKFGKEEADLKLLQFGEILSKAKTGKPGRSGSLNPMFGKTHSKDARERISKANTGIGNPRFGKGPPDGFENGWSGWYLGNYRGESWKVHFRSSNELRFLIENNALRFKTGETQELKVEYTNKFGICRNYFLDFIGDCILNQGLVFEIKPLNWNKCIDEEIRFIEDVENVLLKRKAAQDKFGDKYLFIEIKGYSPKEMCEFRKSGVITFDKGPEKKYRKYIKNYDSKR